MKKILLIFLIFLLFPTAYALTQSWNFELYPFNKTGDGCFFCDACHGSVDWNVWNTTDNDIAIVSNKCRIFDGVVAPVQFVNVNHTVPLGTTYLGYVMEADNWTVTGTVNTAPMFFILRNMSHGCTHGATCTLYDEEHLGWGVTNVPQQFDLYFNSGANIIGGANPTGFQPMIIVNDTQNHIVNNVLLQINTGTTFLASKDLRSITQPTFFGFSAYQAGEVAIDTNFDNLRGYPLSENGLVNFTVTFGGIPAQNFNISLYNTTTETLIDRATANAAGLIQLNLSKGAGAHYGFPFDITVVLQDTASAIAENVTVNGTNVSGIYPTDVFLWALPGSSTTLDVTLNSPANNTYNDSSVNNYCYTPVFNWTIGECELWTNYTGSWEQNKTNETTVINNTQNCINWDCGREGTLLWNIVCYNLAPANGTAAFNFTHKVDTVDPVITIYRPLNNSFHRQPENLILDGFCTDPTVFIFNITLFNSTNITTWQNTTTTATTLKLNRTLALASYAEGNYTINFTCSDGHTSLDWDPKITTIKQSNSLEFTFDDRDPVKIEITDLAGATIIKFEPIKLFDRIILNTEFSKKPSSFTYKVYADDITQYYSQYAGHLILNKRYWFDVEPLSVISIEHKKGYSLVRVGNIPSKAFATKSIGGLNIVNEQRFIIIHTTPPHFPSHTTIPIAPVINDNVNMSIQIIEGNPEFYRLAWNGSGTMTNESITSYIANQNVSFIKNVNVTGEFCYMIWANDSAGNINVSPEYCYNVTPFSVTNFLYGNFTEYSGINYTRVLNANFTYRCGVTTNLSIFFNNSELTFTTFTCDNAAHDIAATINPGTEFFFNISMFLNTSLGNALYGGHRYNASFLADLNAPEAVANLSVNIGFNNNSVNTSLRCNDTVSPILEYNITYNQEVFHAGNRSANLTLSNLTIPVYGPNNITGVCSDFFESTTSEESLNIYFNNITIINERTAGTFDLTNVSSAILFFGNTSFYNFSRAAVTSVNFTGTTDTKLRFEIEYYDGRIINTYLDTSLLKGSILLCANTDGIQLAEQLLRSSQQRAVFVQNTFSNCFVAADYTRFAHEGSLILKAHTIPAQYRLITISDEQQVTLAGMDGSIAADTNIDSLEFNLRPYAISIRTSSLAIQPNGSDQVMISYINLDADNAITEVTITNLDDTSIVFNQVMANPNNFTIFYNFLAANVTNSTLFRVQLDITKDDGTTETIKRYFNRTGNKGLFRNGFALFMASALLIFGLTLTVTKATFSWFGIFITIGALAILSFAVGGWYILFMQAICIVFLLYDVILIVSKNYPTVA